MLLEDFSVDLQYDNMERIRGCGAVKKKYHTVGEMAKLANLSSQTLRYYDQIGLFKPAYTDQATNYRYYAESQLYLLDLIKSLRFVGTPLEKIKEVQYFSIEDMIRYLDEQEHTIEDQLARLAESQYTLRKTRKQMQEQLAIPVIGEVFIKEEEESRLLCLTVADATPVHVSNDAMLILTETIENAGSVQTIRYGSYYPLQAYDSVQTLYYTQIFIPILTSRQFVIQNELVDIVSMSAGRYIEIAFNYSPNMYITMYNKLLHYIKTHNIAVENTVWEAVMPSNFSAQMDEQLIVELKVKLL